MDEPIQAVGTGPAAILPINTADHGDILYVDFIDGKPHYFVRHLRKAKATGGAK